MFFMLVALVPAVLVPACATTKGVPKAQLDSCQTAHNKCKTDLDAANARVRELEGLRSGEQNELSLARKRLEAYRSIADKFRKVFSGGDLTIILRNGRLVVQLPNSILYDLGKAELKPEGIETVAKVAEVLKSFPERSFLIAGHTDNTPVRKYTAKYKTNWELSVLRALGVVVRLQELGVSPGQLAAVGHGEFMPTSENDNDEGRSQNRRTEIIIMPTLDEIPKLPEKP